MKRVFVKGSLVVLALFTATAFLRAEVKTEDKSQLKFEGMMGRMMGLFGGKAAKEGIVSTVAVKGNRKMTVSDNDGQIIDLAEQKVYNLDLKKKTYEVVTFDEMRRRLQEAQEKASKAAKDNAKDNAKEERPPSEKQMEFDFSVKESGQKRAINGYDCREVVMTITGHEKGKTLEENGGLVMTTHIWLGPSIPALKEIAEFDQRYAKAMALGFNMGDSAEQMAMATAMYPGMKDMIGKMQVESVNMEGAQILTEMTTETVKSQAQVAQEQKPKQESDSSGESVTSVRGLGGMLGKRLARKKEAEPDPNKPANRATIFTMNHELLKIATSVADPDVAIPAGFKEKK
jgi:hypothetical protein